MITVGDLKKHLHDGEFADTDPIVISEDNHDLEVVRLKDETVIAIAVGRKPA
jgi:hypothetical protein